MSGIMMLDHLNERPAARRIEAALHKVYRMAKHATATSAARPLTQEFTCGHLRAAVAAPHMAELI